MFRHHFPLLLCCTGGASQGAFRGGIRYSERTSKNAEDARDMKYEKITAPLLSYPDLCKLCPNKNISPIFLKKQQKKLLSSSLFINFYQAGAVFLPWINEFSQCHKWVDRHFVLSIHYQLVHNVLAYMFWYLLIVYMSHFSYCGKKNLKMQLLKQYSGKYGVVYLCRWRVTRVWKHHRVPSCRMTYQSVCLSCSVWEDGGGGKKARHCIKYNFIKHFFFSLTFLSIS